MEFTGQWSDYPKFGRQFKAEQATEKKPATAAALEKYLGSGLIKGVGPKTAKNIVKHFAAETLTVFEKQIDRLVEVEGIEKKRGHPHALRGTSIFIFQISPRLFCSLLFLTQINIWLRRRVYDFSSNGT
jgi:ATP-dependent exoDNAse (exonuclease V) alpha subunit